MTASRRTKQPAPKDWGQLGPAMRGLPNDQWRAFCHALVTDRGASSRAVYVRAARAAGFGKDSTPAIQGKHAWQIAHDDRMIAAVAEESRKYLPRWSPESRDYLMAIASNPNIVTKCARYPRSCHAPTQWLASKTSRWCNRIGEGPEALRAAS